ncbi:MAG: HEPN domain-containing protein [Chloroflexi bacterium]|nr:HEPN domain-containing protein [Chloroflexota bacterium]
MKSVRINGAQLQAPDELHRRKLSALAHFVRALLGHAAGRHVARILLYGSVARGEAEADSDVDVLVFGVERLPPLEQAVAALAWDVSLQEGEHIAPIVFPLNDLYHPADAFLASTLRRGTEVFAMDELEIRRATARGNYLLALDYIETAEITHAAGKIRGVIDIAYNAAELVAKAFLALEMEHIPGRHGQVIGRFSEIFILKKQLVPAEIGRRLNILLDRRHKSRYHPRSNGRPR